MEDKKLKDYPEYSGARFDYKSDIFVDEEALSPEGDLLQTIFAPDPVTGVPRSDLALILSKDSSPAVAQYIRDTLMQPRSTSSAGSEEADGDFVLASFKSRQETFEEYADRLRSLCKPNPE